MYKDEDLKVLLGNSIEEPEVDYDDEIVESQTGYPVEESALKQFYDVSVTDYMGTKEFKDNYLSVKSKIRMMSTEDQQLLANSIVDRLDEKYDFELFLNYTPYSQGDINELYYLIEFIEYDHEKFITNIWKYLNVDLNSIQLEKFCEQNDTKIFSEIEDQLQSHYYPELIAIFLRTYNKDKLIEWFCEKTRNLYTSILISLREE